MCVNVYMHVCAYGDVLMFFENVRAHYGCICMYAHVSMRALVCLRM